jgi:hypothetical protein
MGALQGQGAAGLQRRGRGAARQSIEEQGEPCAIRVAGTAETRDLA